MQVNKNANNLPQEFSLGSQIEGSLKYLSASNSSDEAPTEFLKSEKVTTSNAVLEFMRSPISSCFGMVGRMPSDLSKGR
jgi:hypothetical protein